MKSAGLMRTLCVSVLSVLSVRSAAAFADTKRAETFTTDQVNFVNEMLGFSVKKPEGWVAQNTTELLALQRKGSSLMAGDDRAMKESLDKAVETNLPLFAFLSHPLGTKGQAIISVVSAAENIKSVPSNVTACDYLDQVKSLMSKAAVKVTMSEKCKILDTGNAKLSYFDAKTEINGVTIQQRFHACRKKDYMMNVVQSYLDDKGREQTSDIVKTLKIQCD